MLLSAYTNNTISNTHNDGKENDMDQRRKSSTVTMKENDQGEENGKKDVPVGLTVNGTTPSGKPRLYVCTTCTRAFARQEHLNRHERSHTHEKPFVCGVCERAFSRRDLLLRHAQKLHAGCADAITRIRKKSARRKSSTTTAAMSRKNSNISTTSTLATTITAGNLSLKSKAKNRQNGYFKSEEQDDEDDLDDMDDEDEDENESGNFDIAGNNVDTKRYPYINLTAMQSSYPDIPSNIMTNSTATISPTTPANGTSTALQNHGTTNGFPSQLQHHHSDTAAFFDHGEDHLKRRASFSAVSSANYSMPIPNTSYAENVEFATPSLQPTNAPANWLNGLELDSIPELSLFNMDASKSSNTTQQQASSRQQQQRPESPFGSLSTNPGRQSSQDQQKAANNKKQSSQDSKPMPNISGYSFYENDEDDGLPVVESLFSNHHLFKTPNFVNKLRSDDTYSPADENRHNSASLNNSVGTENNVDRNLNEIEEITDLNIPKMYDVPAGYSFYGNADQQSNNSASSNATISPSLLDNAAHNLSNMSTPPQRIVIQTANTFTSMMNLDKYSRIMLFSPILRSHINHTLNNYPFVGVKVPNLPSNDKLNVYSQVFIERFLPHYPFVHKSMLNEYSLMKTTLADVKESMSSQIELDNLRASVSCLPLLVATIGALLNDEKSDANSLYEVSRRCIHVYLDSRKKKTNNNSSTATGLNNNNASPLWLIQSLTLSVIYGLFADNEVSINVVIRQVNALTALVKSSEMTKIRWDYNAISTGERRVDENYFYDFIKYESAVRTIHSIFHVVITLTSLYNIAPSLKIDDLDLDLPNSAILWNSSNFGEFKSYYNGFAVRPENYKRCLNKLISIELMSNHNELKKVGGFFFNHHVSDFGLICLQNGLHQLFYYNKLYGVSQDVTRQNSVQSLSQAGANAANSKDPLHGNYLNICKIWNLMINQCKLYSNENELVCDSKLMNYHLLLKDSSFQTQFSFNLRLHKLKEQVWLKDYDKMCDIFKGSTSSAIPKNSEPEEDTDAMANYCILILKEFFYSDLEIDFLNAGGVSVQEYLLNYDHFLRLQVMNFVQQLDRLPDEEIKRAHNNLDKVCSLQFQILFDVFIVLIKYVLNFDRFKKNDHDDLHSSFSFHNSPANNEDRMDIDEDAIHHREGSVRAKAYNVTTYASIIKLISSLQSWLDHEYQFDSQHRRRTEGIRGGDDAKQNMLILNDGIVSHDDRRSSRDDDNDGRDDVDDDVKIFTGLKDHTHHNHSDNELLVLPSEKILNNFFTIIDFVFDFIILNKLRFKFGCFKNLNCALIKLNFFIFNDELVLNDSSANTNTNQSSLFQMFN